MPRLRRGGKRPGRRVLTVMTACVDGVDLRYVCPSWTTHGDYHGAAVCFCWQPDEAPRGGGAADSEPSGGGGALNSDGR